MNNRASLSAAPAPRTPARIGRFHIVRELASGSLGTVYLGRDPIIDREVAIKTFSSTLPPTEKKGRQQQLVNESRAAGRLSHPNIVTIFEAASEANVTYMAMEYLRGQELSGLMERGHRFPLTDVMSISWKLADALSYAHQNGVIHRDIKPANIFMVSDRNPKIVDFGIARAPNRIAEHDDDGLGDETGAFTLFKKDNLLGTPNYMSPEQAQGKPADERSDIYSLGAVMYEMLTGRKPFQSNSTEDLLQAIAYKAPPPPGEVNPNIPSTIAEIVMRAMSKKPEKRYQTAEEMADDIKAYMARERQSRRVKKSQSQSAPAMREEEAEEEVNNMKARIIGAAAVAAAIGAAILWLR